MIFNSAPQAFIPSTCVLECKSKLILMKLTTCTCFFKLSNISKQVALVLLNVAGNLKRSKISKIVQLTTKQHLRVFGCKITWTRIALTA